MSGLPSFRHQVLFFKVLIRAHRPLALTWWSLVIVTALLTPATAVAMGVLVSAVQSGNDPTLPLIVVGVTFFVWLSMGPFQQAVNQNLGSRAEGWMRRVLTRASMEPTGIAHLEHPEL